ncbi:unnamed protein product [Cylindrotheca closterium]|uniref:Uncharacterized protein n=1 Tax=Cylindrotheca closterium TaxID=2856 RepID=A0AAD2G958_9STRA|nr:unnamed protein product [Cylindrotheca closterium]
MAGSSYHSQSRKSGIILRRCARLGGFCVPALIVLFFLLHSRLIVLLERDFKERQHGGFGDGMAQQEHDQLWKGDSSSNNNNNNNNPGICQKLLQGNEHSTTASMWLKSKHKLLSAVLGVLEKQQSATSAIIPAWMEELWKFLTPWQLQQTIFPQVDPLILQRILEKLQARLLFLQQLEGHYDSTNTTDRNNPEPPPPNKIQVLVFGGSVTEGVGCDAPPPSYLMDDTEKEKSQLKLLSSLSLQDCSWPHRLQQLADAFLPDTIEIHNLAVGGTHSRAAVPILEHGLYPPHVHVNENKNKKNDAAPHDDHDSHEGPPDIILNAYAANDNLPPAFYNTENTTLDNFHKYRVLKRLMEFVAAASGTGTVGGKNNINSCGQSSTNSNSQQQSHQPWIVFLNDYLGNQQESLVGESTVDELVQLLMQTLAPVSYVSPSRLLEPYVWANTSEHVWSGVWKKKSNKNKNLNAADYKVDVHYGLAGHITTALVAAHAFFQWTMEYCQEQVLFDDVEEQDCSSSSHWTTTTPKSLQTLETRMQAHELSSVLQIHLPSKEWMKLNHPDRVYPNITEGAGGVVKSSRLGSSSKTVTHDGCSGSSSGHQNSGACAFAFLAAPLGTHSKKGPLQEYIDGFTVTAENKKEDGVGWLVQNNFRHGGFQNKLGLAAIRTGAQLTLDIPIGNVQQQRHMELTIHYLKSYGPDWANSHLRGTCQVRQQKGASSSSSSGGAKLLQVLREQNFDLEGFHDQQVSISYTHVVPDIIIDKGIETVIQLKLELIGGSNFKINAMMLC